MKRIGILYDNDSKKVFLLPNEIKALVDSGISVTIPSGIGSFINLSDQEFTAAGAHVVSSWQDVVNSSDILLKVNSFNKTELAAIGKKTAITMTSYLANVEMIYNMLINKTTGLYWNGLTNKNEYLFFPQLEEKKAQHILKLITDAFKNGLAKKEKDKVVYPKNPKLLILNATYAGIALAKLAIKAGLEVTISDNDTKYLNELKSSAGLNQLRIMDSNYETLVELIKQQNAFVATSLSPIDITRTRITKSMAESMPKGSLLIDASCEYGYAFQFVKKYVDKDIQWNKISKSYYLANEDLTNLFAREASEIISKKSVDYLKQICEEKGKFEKITICHDGKVVNTFINNKLRLY